MGTKINKIHTATTLDTVTYFYDAIADIFASSITVSAIVDSGFHPTHKITIDSGLTAQEIDVIFQREIYPAA